MCSIIGFKVGTKEKHEENIEEYFKILNERGDQSFGYFYRTPDNETYFNKALTLEPLLDQIKEAPKGSWCFMHARKASAGMAGKNYNEKLARAHPVESDDKLITLIHNGTKSSIHDTVYGSLSDSQGLATLLSIAWEGRRDYYGEVGVVVYEKAGNVYLYKDGMRPLVMSEDDTIFASEPISDKVKWKNIKNTYGALKGSDVKLNLKTKGLGLEFDEPVEIAFDIAQTTVKNFSIAGYPKTAYCSICKKTHLKMKDRYSCCTCRIEGRVATTNYSKGYNNKNTKKTNTNTNVNKKLPDGVVQETSGRDIPANHAVMYCSDVTLLKSVGYNECSYVGNAIVRANEILKNSDGLLFVKPNKDGKYLVKVDKVLVPMSSNSYKHSWSALAGYSLPIVGSIDPNSILKLDEHINISTSKKKYEMKTHPLRTTITKKLRAGAVTETVGFLPLTEGLQFATKGANNACNC